jgi:monoamine oxidase
MGACCAGKVLEDISIAPEDIVFKGKVVVVGAGVAGLVAANLLKEHNCEVQILEASSRFGGRIRDAPADFADFRVAVGAEWVHSKHAMGGHDARCPIFEDITNGKSTKHAIFPDKVADLNVVKGGNPQLLGKWSMDRKIFNMDGDNKFSNSSWYAVLEERVLPSVKEHIVYDSPVTAINYQQANVVVTTQDGTSYEADKVLVCVPLVALKKSAIAFTPPIPEPKAAALHSVKTSPGAKVFFEFATKFYPHFTMMKPFSKGGWQNMYFDEVRAGVRNGLCNTQSPQFACSGAVRRMHHTLRCADRRAPRPSEMPQTVGKANGSAKHILCAVLLGDEVYSRVTAKGSDAASIKEFCLNELDSIFEGQATKNLVNCVVQDWTTEPHILQGIPDLEGVPKKTLQLLSEPLGSKVFFAGDAMNLDAHNNGYVQGACEASYIAVKKMLCEKGIPVVSL